MLRRALLPCLLLTTAAVAHADAATVAVRSARLPLELAMRMEARSEHGCSQSHASTSDDATIALRVNARGVAELTLDRLEHGSFGPSFGRFQEGDREFSYTTERVTRRFSGRATVTAGRVELRFDRVEAGNLRIAGMSEVAPPPTTTTPTSLRVDCRIEETDVYPVASPSAAPMYAADGEASSRVPLVRCTFPDGVPDGFGLLGQAGGELVLGRGTGIVLHYHQSFGGPASLVRLR